MRKAAVFLIFISAFALLASCDKKRVYDEYEPIQGGWEKDSTLVFKLEELDSLQNYNLFINVRNNKDYNYRNLFLITEMRFPQGKVITDTLEYEMAAPDGSWLGTGFGDVKESKLWYKENVSFTEPGEYKIAIKQAMRKNDEVEGIENLEGITHIGFRIEENLQ
ncbi:gliding motility lipoprotein GldH [Salegentibacter salegens]|uniref:Protein involved in gliding motility GldH n=1 Tax=Salegentibacter salegens TaxID=143223 RepID=A0A1M7MJ36_9FLAO|nr:gliding motility lipoprotein GldH [Salegentibacter salegens]PRX48156.1 gliding motility-associated lipoprotein GldH [Salegentibacter salegens]SHM90917.1 protein involved in gliding motility GldH [Salegentibacter salegens]